MSEATFGRTMIWVSLSRLAGTLAAQVMLVPAAVVIARAAGWLQAQAGRAASPLLFTPLVVSLP